MSQRDLTVRVDGNVDGFTRSMKNAEQSAKVFERELKRVEDRQTAAVAHVTRLRSQYEAQATRELNTQLAARKQAMGQLTADAGRASLAIGAALAAGVAVSVRAAAQWESAWAGVLKTADTEDPLQLGRLESDLRQLARTLPATHQEIAAVAEAAGQLGISTPDVAAFTKVMIDLGETTNLSSDQAASSLAQLANVLGTSSSDFDRMGAALVALGNNGASTEADIVEMALRISGAGKQVGLAEADVFALASALSSVGINAEAGGTAVSSFLSNLNVLVATGGSGLQDFADVAGMSVEQFSDLFRRDAAMAVGAFTDGLGRINEAGGSAIATLEEMGISEVRMRDALLRLAGAQGLVTASVDLGREAWAANNALVEEATKRYDTTEAKMQVARNAANDLAIDLGSTLLPALAGVADGVGDFAGFLADLPGWMQKALVVVATLATVTGLAGGAALIAVPKYVALKASLDAVALSAGRAGKALTFLGRAGGMAGLALAAVAVGYALGKVIEGLVQLDAPELDAFTTAVRNFATDGALSGDAADRLGDKFGKLGDTIRAANATKFSITDQFSAIDINEAKDLLEGLDATLAGLVQSGNADQAARAFEEMTRQAKAQGISVDELNAKLPKYGDAQAAAAAETKSAAGEAEVATAASQALADALSGVDASATNAFSGLGAYAASLSYTEEQTKELTKQIEQWGEALGGFVQPLGAYTDLLAQKEAAEQASAEKTAAATESQEDSWEDYAREVGVSVGEYLAELERQVAAQEAHADNMLRLAGRVSQGTLDELARMGPEGAPLVAQLVNASDAELAKLDDLYARRTSDATGAMAAELYLAQVLLPQIAATVGQKTATALALELAAGTTTVAQIARDYAAALEGGINPLLRSIGGRMAVNPRGGVQEFADGGIEDHVAQIAKGGTWRVWAEDETGGEAYIPLAPAKRQRSLSIWRETGRRLGQDVQAFAAGGFSSLASIPRPPSTKPFGPPISSVADRMMALAFGEASEFVKANLVPALSQDVGVAKMMAALRSAFPGLPLLSGLRPGAITATGNPSYHGMGRATDLPPRMDVFNWLAQNYPTSRELIFSPAGARQVRNGAPHLYSGVTKAMHYDHVHWAMRQGGILNPHVRDAGGPLLPGFTYNGTGRPEMVLPMADGGVVGGMRSPIPTGSNLAREASKLGSPAAIRALVEAWKAYNEQLDEAERRQELVTGVAAARQELAAAKGVDARTSATDKLADATKRLAEFDRDGGSDRALAQAEARAEALEKRAQAAKEAAEWAADVARTTKDAQDKALDELNRMLDAEQAVYAKRADAERQYTEKVADIRRQQAALTARLTADSAAAAESLRAQQTRLLADRRVQLEQWARLDQVSAVQWGNTVDQLLLNARAQAGQFEEWMASLAAARSRGVSEQVISALGLDQGPEALGQLRQFGQATVAEIEALNAEVARRTALAGQQVSVEQQGSLGALGRDLLAAQETYTEAITELQARYVEDQATLEEELLAAQADLLVRQAEFATELAAIGQEQGRAYGTAVADGMLSQLPAVQAAAASLMAAAADAQAAAAQATALAGAPGAPGRTVSGAPPKGTAGSFVLNGQMVNVNAAGIITSGPNKGIYPSQVRTATYDQGGWLQPGYTLAFNGTGRPERVTTAAASGGTTVVVQINAPVFGVDQLRQVVRTGAEQVLAERRDAALAHA